MKLLSNSMVFVQARRQRGTRGRRVGKLAFLLAAVSVSFTIAASSLAYEGSDKCSAPCLRELDVAREATKKYELEAVALADGYAPITSCVESDEGAMGIHYVGPEYFEAGLDITHPELLLYIPTPTGKRLVGIEYYEGIRLNGEPYFGEQPPPREAEPSKAPVIFHHKLDGPMPGHDELSEWHYDLHVWLFEWAPNPRGTFEEWNPNLSC